MPAGKVSLTVVVPVELDGPALETVILYWPVPPAVNVPCATFVTERSKTALSVVGGVVAGPLLPVQAAVVHSFGLLMLTWFEPSGFGALGLSVTSSTSIELPPDGIEAALVQVTFGTAPAQDQPAL